MAATQFLSLDEFQDFIAIDVQALGVKEGEPSEAYLVEVIKEVEADLIGILTHVGVSSPATMTETSAPYSFRMCKSLVKYGCAYKSLKSIAPMRTASDLTEIEHYKAEWERMRQELLTRPGLLSDLTLGEATLLGPDHSSAIGGWTAAELTAAGISNKFAMDDQF